MRILPFAFFFFCIGISQFSIGQDTDCELILNQATDEYNAGHFYSISSILEPCMNKFTREQRQRANLLLTQTYLLLDNPSEAEKSYLKLLQANPEFTVDESRDPIDVVYLSKKFTASPIFSINAKIGMNTSPVQVIRYENITGDQYKSKYKLQPGWQVGLGGEWHIRDDISLNAELDYATSAFRTEKLAFGNDLLEIRDIQNWLTVPISIKYSDLEGKFRPYGYVGYSVQWLFKDKAEIVTTNRTTQGDATIETLAESPLLDFTYRRNKVNRSFFLGGGVKVKVKLDYFFVDLRYSLGLTNLVNEEAQYLDYSKYGEANNNTSSDLQDSGDAVYRYWYVDDYFRIDNLAISFGYIHPLYKPRKLKKARTKSLFKKIEKSDDVE